MLFHVKNAVAFRRQRTWPVLPDGNTAVLPTVLLTLSSLHPMFSSGRGKGACLWTHFSTLLLRIFWIILFWSALHCYLYTKLALKFKAGTSILIFLIWTQWLFACLMISAGLKTQVFSDPIYMKEKRRFMTLLSQNLRLLSLQGKAFSLKAYVVELHQRYILIPMLSLTRFIDLDKQCLISLVADSQVI